jgi:hypothetical protein
MAMDPSRLYTQLLNTGLQNKDNPLYQLIYQLIGALVKLNSDASSSGSSSSGSTVINPMTVLGLIGVAGNDGESSFIPGPQGNRGADGNAIIGLDGQDGLDGVTIPGMQGPCGPMGIMGPSGVDGIDGDTIVIPGPTGATGATGPAGSSGTGGGNPGIDGNDGIDSQFLSLIPPFLGEVTLTTTGNIDDLDFSASIVRMNNASLATIRGLKPGFQGQRVTFVSIGAGQVNFAHQDTNSTAAFRLINFVTSGITPLAAGKGSATFQYDTTTSRWRLIQHEQGGWIDVAYSAGNFAAGGAMTWTVDAADQKTYAFWLKGNTLFFEFDIRTTSIGGVLNAFITIAIPNSWTVVYSGRLVCYLDNESFAFNNMGFATVIAAGTVVNVLYPNSGNFNASANGSSFICKIFFAIN